MQIIWKIIEKFGGDNEKFGKGKEIYCYETEKSG